MDNVLSFGEGCEMTYDPEKLLRHAVGFIVSISLFVALLWIITAYDQSVQREAALEKQVRKMVKEQARLKRSVVRRHRRFVKTQNKLMRQFIVPRQLSHTSPTDRPQVR